MRSHLEKYPKWFVGAVGFLASYNGRFFDGGYAGIVHTKSGTVRDYYDEAKRNVLSQRLAVEDVTFLCNDYAELSPRSMVVYCDPPYYGVKQYATSKGFDHDKFWDVMRKWSKNNVVLISESSAPEDFKIIWEKKVTRTQDNAKRVGATERLFMLKTD